MMKQPIQIGDLCPIFNLPNSENKQITISDYLGKKILVIFFYPKDNTPGCTKEVCAFRDAYEDFLELGCEVFGISSDQISAHMEFEKKYQLPYPLLSDSQKIVRRQFGVPANLFGLIPGRVTYIIGLDKRVAGIYNSQMNPIDHIEKSLESVRQLQLA